MKWIRVFDKLPDHRNSVMLFDGVNICFGYMNGAFDRNIFYVLGYNENFENIISHWMPLPKPPEDK